MQFFWIEKHVIHRRPLRTSKHAFFQPHKLLNIAFNEVFEMNNLLNEIKNKKDELWFHENYHQVNKHKCVCFFEMFGQVVEISGYVFMSVINKDESNLYLLENLLNCQHGWKPHIMLIFYCPYPNCQAIKITFLVEVGHYLDHQLLLELKNYKRIKSSWLIACLKILFIY